MATVTSEKGDTLERLCWRHQNSHQYVSQTLALNPGLAKHGPVLPTGTQVNLPDLASTQPAVQPTVNLWT